MTFRMGVGLRQSDSWNFASANSTGGSSDFCMVVALGSDGQVEAPPVVADPMEMCQGAEIPSLLAPPS